MNEEKETMNGNWCGPRGRRWWFLAPVFGALALVVFGFAVMYIWNTVLTHIFTSVATINFSQAVLLLILSRILFGGFRGGRGCGCGRGGRWGGRGNAWKEKWMSMTDEEKAKFKEEWKSRCC